jgi:hypothetical protein
MKMDINDLKALPDSLVIEEALLRWEKASELRNLPIHKITLRSEELCDENIQAALVCQVELERRSNFRRINK